MYLIRCCGEDTSRGFKSLILDMTCGESPNLREICLARGERKKSSSESVVEASLWEQSKETSLGCLFSDEGESNMYHVSLFWVENNFFRTQPSVDLRTKEIPSVDLLVMKKFYIIRLHVLRAQGRNLLDKISPFCEEQTNFTQWITMLWRVWEAEPLRKFWACSY